MPEIAEVEGQATVSVSKMAMRQTPANIIVSMQIQLFRRTWTILRRVISTEHCEAQAMEAQRILLAKAYCLINGQLALAGMETQRGHVLLLHEVYLLHFQASILFPVQGRELQTGCRSRLPQEPVRNPI